MRGNHGDMSKNTDELIIDTVTIKKIGDSKESTQLYSIEVRAGKVKYVKEVHIEFTDGMGHQLQTIANYLEFMARVIKRQGA